MNVHHHAWLQPEAELARPQPTLAPDRHLPVADLPQQIVVDPTAPLADCMAAPEAGPLIAEILEEGLNPAPPPQPVGSPPRPVLRRGLILRRPLV